jgi:hypothetical protein
MKTHKFVIIWSITLGSREELDFNQFDIYYLQNKPYSFNLYLSDRLKEKTASLFI